MDLSKAIESRRSIRKFKEKSPNWRTIIECIDSMRYAPMTGNNFSLKFILVADEDKIQKITKAAQQPFILQAKFIVVVCSNPSRTLNAYGENGKIWLKQQAGAAIENFLLKITESGLATCWVGYFVEDQIKKVLKIPEDIEVEAIFPIGYNFDKSSSSINKISLDRVLYFDTYGNKHMRTLRQAY